MNIRALKVKFLDDASLEVTFQDGKIIRYDTSKIVLKCPMFEELLRNRQLFKLGYLGLGGSAIMWNNKLHVDVENIYKNGELVGYAKTNLKQKIGVLLVKTREEQGITQTQLSMLTRIDQGDISRIEKGYGNPTLTKLEKLFGALKKDLSVVLEDERKS